MSRLFQSSKFWTLLIDQVVSVGLLWVAYYIRDPELYGLFAATIGGIQAVALAVVAGIAYEDGQAKRAVTYNDNPGG